ncbi:hypothetical protein, partial [Streptomyces sp. NPDC089915]|uniref:hypothetical protein n=1 Tax=Streptomyces sp. NPDC089915 TaxID=3155186 RepID=UPI00343CCCFB
MANFVYDILTDPAPLQVPVAGEESRGAVFIVVSNPKHKKARWSSIQVRVPVGEREDALTPDPKAVTAAVLPDRARGPEEEPLVDWDSATGVCTLTAREGASLGKAGSMILALEGFPVSSTPGPVLLQVTEIVESDMWTDESPVTLSLLKQAPRVPRNFRPQLSLVAAGTDVVLRWDGPDTLLYAIQGPDGPPQPVPARQGGAGWQWSPAPGDEPKRDATYTLIATSPAPVPQQSGYFLTTTVHLLSPEFESVTATRGTHTPWVEGTEGRGKIYFTPEGAEIRVGGDASDAGGLLGADKAELKSLETDRALVNEALAVGAEADLDAASGAGGQTVVNRSVVGGNLTVNGRTDIKGELHAAQDAVVDGGLSVAGTSALNDLTVASQATIGGDLTVGGTL